MYRPIVVGVLFTVAGCSQLPANPDLPARPPLPQPTMPAPPQEVGAVTAVAVGSCERNVDGGMAALPDAARAALESRYPSWEVAPHCPDDVEQYLALHGRRTPSVTAGDFDGDGRSDLAVLLRARSGWPGAVIVVFLDSERGSTPIVAGGGLDVIATIA